ncbi:polysaccharide deacetylase family protein [Paenibacillus sp. PL2-23]|uniref:polysaccharide deacetylase family protein n=1 Tax=Paenibacillus sp. PL2-23 TaxID=2100729 RepID=UPI0030F9D58C
MRRGNTVSGSRWAAVVVLLAGAVGLSSCAVSQSYGLSTLVYEKQHGEVIQQEQEKVLDQDAGAGKGSDGVPAVFVPEDEKSGTQHGILRPGENGGGAIEADAGVGAGAGAGSGTGAGIDVKTDAGTDRAGAEVDGGEGGKEKDREADAGAGVDAGKDESEDSRNDSAVKPEELKRVALTFDDGPDPHYTTAILDILREKGVKATFFVVGSQVEKYPDVMKRMIEEGHAVGNHTHAHKNLTKLSRHGIIEEIEETDDAILETLGFEPELFRAPYGAVSDTLEAVLEETNRRLVGWTVDTRDWAGTPISEMRKMIRKETEPDGIILLHSFGGKHIRNTVEMLPEVIDDLHELGFTLVTADHIPE